MKEVVWAKRMMSKAKAAVAMAMREKEAGSESRQVGEGAEKEEMLGGEGRDVGKVQEEGSQEVGQPYLNPLGRGTWQDELGTSGSGTKVGARR